MKVSSKLFLLDTLEVAFKKKKSVDNSMAKKSEPAGVSYFYMCPVFFLVMHKIKVALNDFSQTKPCSIATFSCVDSSDLQSPVHI